MFRVGQKVVCVDGAYYGPASTPVGPWVTKGEIYTIKTIDLMTPLPDSDYGVQVYELPTSDEFGFYFWRASRFRPLVDRPTDISVFRALLNPDKETV